MSDDSQLNAQTPQMWRRTASPSRLVGADEAEEDTLLRSLRPQRFSEYIGQSAIKENLIIACQAAARRGEALDHVLLHGPPGLGKTSLAKVVSQELGVGFKATSGPVIERPGDLAALLTGLHTNDVLFIDEIHRLPRVVEEVLYPAMEDFEIDVMIGQGPAAKSVKIKIKPFTLVGATTRTGLLTSPLRDRFGIAMRLAFYSTQELALIVKRSAAILEVSIDEASAHLVALRARGTPRIANRILKRLRDFAQERGTGAITEEVVRRGTELMDIDASGLDMMDRMILETIIDKFQGGPVGVETIAAALGEDRETLEDVYEPFLLQAGFLARTRRGRQATDQAYAHLGRTPRQGSQLSFDVSKPLAAQSGESGGGRKV